MSWIKGAKRLPGLFTTVKWRNADGGNIPLADATPLEHYQRTGANINWHEWLDESTTPVQAGEQDANQDQLWEEARDVANDVPASHITYAAIDKLKQTFTITKNK